MTAPLRGTQSLVGQMGWVTDRPSLIALEVLWRWLFGIPFLLVCFTQAQRILAALPLETAGFNEIDTQNPWVAAVQISHVWAAYQPHWTAVLHWLLPAAAVAWMVVSGLGRSLVFKRMDPKLPFRPLPMIALQAAWLALAAAMAWDGSAPSAGLQLHTLLLWGAGSGGLLDLVDLSFACVLHRMGAGELAAADCAAADAQGRALGTVVDP